MVDKVLYNIKSNCMIDEGNKILVAVSGGADSMCLLHLLHTLKKSLNISLVAAHLNHCLRGDESDRDEECVKKFCEELNIEFYSKRVDIHNLCKEKNISCEMAGRDARYGFFEELSKKLGVQKIALAHNANDQAETVFMRIMRGTGLSGLVGIKPVRDKIFIRPILNVSRIQIEEYCVENNVKYRTDKSNFENIYARNKVRLELIPYIEKNFNKDIVKTINRLADTVKNDNDFLEDISNKMYKTYCYKKLGRVIIDKDAFSQHEAILNRIIRLAITEIKGDVCNLEKSHILSIINIQKYDTGKIIMLPEGIIAENTYKDIYIYIKNKDNKLNEKKEYKLSTNGENYIEDIKKTISVNTFIKNEQNDFKSDNWTKYFDYDKIQDNIILRYRKDGDKFAPLGMKGSKKLKDLFMDLKIPKEERDRIPLVCFGNDIAWVMGYRVSEKFKVDKDTKNILKIKIQDGGII